MCFLRTMNWVDNANTFAILGIPSGACNALALELAPQGEQLGDDLLLLGVGALGVCGDVERSDLGGLGVLVLGEDDLELGVRVGGGDGLDEGGSLAFRGDFRNQTP